jgi:hypothetical protein
MTVKEKAVGKRTRASVKLVKTDVVAPKEKKWWDTVYMLKTEVFLLDLEVRPWCWDMINLVNLLFHEMLPIRYNIRQKRERTVATWWRGCVSVREREVRGGRKGKYKEKGVVKTGGTVISMRSSFSSCVADLKVVGHEIRRKFNKST